MSCIKFSNDTSSKFIIIRHGQTDYNLAKDNEQERINPNFIDGCLNEKGIEQAKSLQETLNKLDIVFAYCSPLNRALQTASFALSSHPKKENIVVKVHPWLEETIGYLYDLSLDIKEKKKLFNLYSEVKFDWSLFDEYSKSSKFDENLFYFVNFILFNEENEILDEWHKKLKHIYDQGNIGKLKEEINNMYVAGKRKNCTKLESLKHVSERVNKLKDFLLLTHKDKIHKKDEKIILFGHGSLIKVATSQIPYDNDFVDQYDENSALCGNCECLSLHF